MNITRFGKGYALMVNKNVYCLEQSLVEPSSLNLSLGLKPVKSIWRLVVVQIIGRVHFMAIAIW